MITPSMIYWANECDSINVFFAFMIFFEIVFLVTWAISGWIEYFNSKADHTDFNYDLGREERKRLAKENNRELRSSIFQLSKSIWGVIGALIICSIGAIFVPTTNAAYQMYIIPTVTNSKLAQQLPAQIEQYIQTVLKEKPS